VSKTIKTKLWWWETDQRQIYWDEKVNKANEVTIRKQSKTKLRWSESLQTKACRR
jgi:hypothetical protein